MKEIISFVAIDGTKFEEKERCRVYEEKLKNDYNLLKSIKVYNDDGNLIACPPIEEFYGIAKRDSYEFFEESYYLRFDDNTDVDRAKMIYRYFAEEFGVVINISSKDSMYNTYIFKHGNVFVPIDEEIIRIKERYNFIKRMVGGILYE